MKRDHFSFEIEILRSIVSFWCVKLMFAQVHNSNNDNNGENNNKNKEKKIIQKKIVKLKRNSVLV